MFIVAEMNIQLGIESGFHGDFGELLPKIIEVILGLDVLRSDFLISCLRGARKIGEGFKF